ncbi:hypothetical protein C0Q70_08828 [Pomacea canaliculata]|uniref:Integrin beta n=1 Tax=Pomacea canaliculata TaxID=400727 RepID=A0A2T7P827_POMCA|nr:hypothetical protein C0Q70_08828 [Pomacea canaliculata]
MFPRLLIFLVVLFLVQGEPDTNPCLSDKAQKSCGACIATAPQCGWCLAENYEKENKLRCDKFENHVQAGGCDPDSIESPQDRLSLVEDNSVQDGERPEDAVQIQPQRVRIKIRPNKPVRVPITFRQAENYPVDLYYLMDLSNSMEDDKDKLAELGNLIAERMSAITKNFRLGFGSFVDKVVMPYVSTTAGTLSHKPRFRCEPPYGFKNHLSLDLDTSRFAKQVMDARVSGNLDAPEGGFDAIMQSVVCDKVIGWREISRRMLVFSTDAGFHYAGDGKLGGIVRPNDGTCHMANNIYTESSNQDYPSVSQIAAKLKEHSVSIIFAVTKDQFAVYEKLSRYIESSTTGQLANDSSNIVRLIEENYDVSIKLHSRVQLKAQNIGKNISVSFFSRCFGTAEKQTDHCEGIKIGQNVTFTAEVTVTECPRTRQYGSKSLVSILLDWQKNLPLIWTSYEINSPKCFDGNGTYECGQCTCNPGRYGKNCECDATKVSSKESDAKCIGENSTVPCSNRGQCVCGVCECKEPRYTGRYCQCDDSSCDYSAGGLCGGPDRGTCVCGTCQCKTGYSGDACDCQTSNTSCIANNGACPGKCEDNQACVQCVAFKSGQYSREECNQKCPRDRIQVVDSLPEREGVRKCQFRDDDDCLFYFTYQYMPDGQVHIKVQQTKVCPESVNVLAIVGGVVGGIVFVGLALLFIWKLLTFLHDRHEFAKFEKERQNAKWDTGGNPIYKQATSTFSNPTYAGKQG